MADSYSSNTEYILQPVLFPALPDLESVNPTSPAATARAVRSVEGSQNHLYLGSSDGQVHVYKLSDQGSSNEVRSHREIEDEREELTSIKAHHLRPSIDSTLYSLINSN